MDEKHSIKDIIFGHSMFEGCAAAFIEQLAEASVILKIPKSGVIFIHQESASRFFIVLKGWIKIFRENADGEQAVIGMLRDGAVFGETSIFDENIYPYSAEATEDSEVLSLPLSQFKNLIEKDPKFALSMLSAMATQNKQLDKELEHRVLQNAPQRIGCFLLQLIKDQEKGGAQTIDLPYDKVLVASRLGMRPETFSRALSQLRDKTGIRVRGSSVEIDDVKDLSNFSCAGCSSEFPCHGKG